MNAGAGTRQPAMQAALEGVTRWRREAEEAIAQRRGELQEEADRLRRDIEELQRQLQELSRLQEESDSRLSALPSEQERRTNAALLEGLRQDSGLIAERSAAYAAAVAGRDSQIQALMGGPDFASKIEAFEQFELHREETLSTVPALYRQVLLQQHETVRRELEPLFEALSAELPPVEADAAAVTLVAGVDPTSGQPEALAVILPLPFDTYRQEGRHEGRLDGGGTGVDGLADGRPAEETLETLLAYRVIGAVAAALRRVGAADAQVHYDNYNGHLVMQIWLADSALQGDLPAALTQELDRARELASELRTARLDLQVTWQPPEVIAPESASSGAAAGEEN